jgi:hypothetical protein
MTPCLMLVKVRSMSCQSCSRCGLVSLGIKVQSLTGAGSQVRTNRPDPLCKASRIGVESVCGIDNPVAAKLHRCSCLRIEGAASRSVSLSKSG